MRPVWSASWIRATGPANGSSAGAGGRGRRRRPGGFRCRGGTGAGDGTGAGGGTGRSEGVAGGSCGLRGVCSGAAGDGVCSAGTAPGTKPWTGVGAGRSHGRAWVPGRSHGGGCWCRGGGLYGSRCGSLCRGRCWCWCWCWCGGLYGSRCGCASGPRVRQRRRRAREDARAVLQHPQRHDRPDPLVAHRDRHGPPGRQGDAVNVVEHGLLGGLPHARHDGPAVDLGVPVGAHPHLDRRRPGSRRRSLFRPLSAAEHGHGCLTQFFRTGGVAEGRPGPRGGRRGQGLLDHPDVGDPPRSADRAGQLHRGHEPGPGAGPAVPAVRRALDEDLAVGQHRGVRREVVVAVFERESHRGPRPVPRPDVPVSPGAPRRDVLALGGGACGGEEGQGPEHRVLAPLVVRGVVAVGDGRPGPGDRGRVPVVRLGRGGKPAPPSSGFPRGTGALGVKVSEAAEPGSVPPPAPSDSSRRSFRPQPASTAAPTAVTSTVAMPFRTVVLLPSPPVARYPLICRSTERG